MKTIKKLGYILAAGVIALSSCNSDLDINRNPYLPADATPDLLLPSGVAYSAAKIGGDLQLIGGFWSQHYTQNNSSNQYKNIDSYNLTLADYNAVWSLMTGGGMKDLYLAKERAEADALWNYYVASSVILAFDYHVLVDFYGDFPVNEGLQGDKEVYAPKWDDGKTVNEVILAQLDAAIAKVDAGAELQSMGGQDFIFQGDMDQWRKFAKTLKLKVLMRDFDANSAAITALLDEGDLLSTDAKLDAFSDGINKSNPLYENDRRRLNTFENIRASKTLLSFLQENNDPRIGVFYEGVTDGRYKTEEKKDEGYTEDKEGHVIDPNGDYIYEAYAQGNFDAPTAAYPIGATSRARLEATDPVYFMSAAESEFLQAEAWARLNDAENAEGHYEAGVTAAFERWGLANDAEALLAGAYAFVGGSTDQMVEQIITQKWVAATRSQAWDSFFDQNRTGYPVVSDVDANSSSYVAGQYTPSIGTVLPGKELPRRLPYPKISSDNNPNTPAGVAINTKMWWHK